MPGHDRNQIQLIICNVTKNTLISVTLDAQGIMPGHDRNKNQCVFCNVVLARVTLSPPGSHLLHWNLFNKFLNFEEVNLQGVPKKTHHKDFIYFWFQSIYMRKIHYLEYFYDKIYTICNYLGFYSSLRDKIWAIGGHLELWVRRWR